MLLWPWDFPGKNTGVGSHFLLQGIFQIQGSNPGLPHGRWILYQLSHQGRPRILEWVAYPFSSRPRNQTGISCIAGRQILYQLSHTVSQSVNSDAQSCPTLCDTMNRSTPGLPVHHQLPEFIQTHIHRVGDAIQPSHPLSFPSPPVLNPSQHQGLFQWVSSSHEVAKVLEFQLQHQSFQWTPRISWLFSYFKHSSVHMLIPSS